MERKSKVVSNKRQLARLVELMEQQQDLAKGICVKSQAKPRWEVIATELNSLGPPIRSWEKWLKVWTDLKSKTKKKMSENRSELRATGGGPNNLHIFTPLEETVSTFLKFDMCVNPPGEEFGVREITSENLVTHHNTVADISLGDIDMEEGTEIQECENLCTPRRRTKKTINQKRIELLETQVATQSDYYKAMKGSLSNIEKLMEKSYRLQKDAYSQEKENIKLKKEKLQLLKEEMVNKKQHRTQKLKLKIQLLELQKENIASITL